MGYIRFKKESDFLKEIHKRITTGKAYPRVTVIAGNRIRPDIDIRNNEVVFSISFPDDSAESKRLRADIDRSIKSLEDAVGYLKRDVDNHNNSAPNTIR